MELADPPAVRCLDGKEGEADRGAALAAAVGDDDLAEGREAETSGALMEGDDLLPLPTQGLRLRRDGSQVPAQPLTVAAVPRGSGTADSSNKVNSASASRASTAP